MDGLATMDVMENQLKKISTAESYTFQNQKGWRRWRILRPGWGMYHDVKRRLPYYWSDITDAFTYRTFASTVRMYFINDYSFVFPTLFWVGFSHFPGRLGRTEQYRVPTVGAFEPTQPRGWVIPFWTLDIKWVFVAVPFGFLMMLLFYYDHNVSSLTAQARQYPLKKPAGFHWDFFLLGCTCFVAGVVGLPLPNGLVPQAPVHTDSLTVYETRLDIVKTKDGDEIRKPLVEATAVVEQRVSHFLMGMAIWGTMTGPLLTVLSTMPAAVFAGVFFVVGWGSIESNGILAKFWYISSEQRFIDPLNPLNAVPRRKLWIYIGLQALGVACAVAISQTIAAIGFPVLIIALIPLRTFLMPKWFSEHELATLDALTANNPAVLVSFGGTPAKMKGLEQNSNESSTEAMGDVERGDDCNLSRTRSRGSRSRSVVRQCAGSITR
ncbi:hypothetical protein SLS59_008307 [Nothophoma quercina]|uniref:Bicarbonate transporter-like transmembrane domain-containing protein n=1 Tax=Nothophoma quercina TaxID=749835 RepID=A0ABR3QT83_9PLEO